MRTIIHDTTAVWVRQTGKIHHEPVYRAATLNILLHHPIGRFLMQVQNANGAGLSMIDVDLNALPQPTGSAVVQVGDTWRIQAWFDPHHLDQTEVPDLYEPPQVELALAKAEPALVSAARDFHESWLLKKDVDHAIASFSERALVCINRTRGEHEHEYTSSAARRQRLREGLQEMAERIGPADRLTDLIVADEPVHPDLGIVRHPLDEAYVLVSVPEQLGNDFLCDSEASLKNPDYYATAFKFIVPGGADAVFSLLWVQEQRQWKVVAWDIETP